MNDKEVKEINNDINNLFEKNIKKCDSNDMGQFFNNILGKIEEIKKEKRNKILIKGLL